MDSLSLIEQQKNHENFIDYAHQLHQELIAPIKGQIDLPEKIIISPHGPLGYLPFELLLKEVPENYANFGSHAYLLKEHQISYTYSATLLHEMKAKKYQASRPDLIAFAPGFEGPKDNLNRELVQIRGDLGALEFNIPEAIGISNILGGTAITGIDATEERFLAEAPNYQIIHLSTHGKANDEQGDFAYLAFTKLKDSLENEFLYNRDLYNMAIKADMVVLSACETGIGELQNGEGIISLARGFSYAGAKSIITSLWSVNDASSKELMEGFYAYIKEGRDKDEALRLAKLDFMDKHVNEAHPFFWAPFIAIGDMEAIQFKANIKYLYYGLTVLLISLLYWNRGRKSKVGNPTA
jgi:CHAT domain-containing protein